MATDFQNFFTVVFCVTCSRILPPTTSGLETEWDYSGRKGRDGQKKNISKANERKRKVKRGKDEINGQGGKEGCPGLTREGVVTRERRITGESSF